MRARLPELAAAGLCLATLVGSLSTQAGPGERPPDLLLLLLTGWNACWLLLARRLAWAAAAAVTLALLLFVSLGYPGGPAYLAGPLVLLLAGTRVAWPARVLMGCGMLAALVAGHVLTDQAGWGDLLARYVGVFAAAILGAEVWRSTQARAAQRAADREVAEQAARDEERMELARELHDSVGHALSVIAIQTRVARAHVTAAPATTALDAVEESAESALQEVRLLVRGFRQPDGAPTTPRQGLGDVGALVTQVRQAGVPVDLQQESMVVSDPVSVAAYRVVQEALTNARRHAPGAACQVQVTCTGSELVVRVRSALRRGGAAEAPEPGGTGLVGLRERVSATGGQFRSGPINDAAWEVQAAWPLPSGC